MGLPLPNVVADTGPGGGVVTSMRGINALMNDIYGNQIKSVQAKYAPLTTQADAASKLAYANLMGPQFLAKLMGNQDILANIPDDQKRMILQKLQQAGTGQGTGNALMGFNQPQGGQGGQNTQGGGNNSLIGFIADKFKNLFNPSQQGGGQQGGNVNALLQNPALSPQDVNAISQLQPGQSRVIQGNPGQGADNGYAYDSQGRNIVASPQEVAAIANGGQPTFAENVANYSGVKKEGEEAGKLRAQDIKDLNDTVYNAETKQATLDDINSMIASPEIREIRQLPLAGRHEMAYYAREGTPAQQQLVGRLYAQMGNVVKDSSRDFAGQFRKGEQQLLQGMKPNDSDTVDSMIGKAESLSVMNKLLMERSRLTSQFMSQYHINKLQASELADKQVNGDKIREMFHNQLNPSPTDDDIQFMAKKYNISPDEVKKRLKAKGIS